MKFQGKSSKNLVKFEGALSEGAFQERPPFRSDSQIDNIWWEAYDPAGVVQSPKTPESRKYEKNTKKNTNPRPQVAPRKYEKMTEKKIQKKAEKLTWGRGFCIFFVIFSYFRDSGVFGLCTTPARS